MKYLNYLLPISFLGVMLCSCTITKRHFGNGYYIEWRTHRGEIKNEVSSSREIAPESAIIPSEIAAPDTVQNMTQTIRVEKEVRNPAFDAAFKKQEYFAPEAGVSPKANGQETVSLKEPKPDNEFPQEKNKKVYPLTWVMMGIPPMIILSYVLVIQSIYFIGGAGIILFALIGLILGIISLVTVKSHPEKYKRTKLTKVFSMICMISCGIILFMAMVYFLQFKH